MTLTQLFNYVNSSFRGTDDDAPTVGTPDYTHWLLTTNRRISDWASDGKNVWQSLFEIRTIGTIVAGTQTYDLDDDIMLPADKVIVTQTNGQIVDYTVVKPQERGRFPRTCYISGSNPQVLTFSDPLLPTNPVIGGTISIAAYFAPADLTTASDRIPVDDPHWLVMAVASELAFNDLTYAAKAGDLNAKANSLYKGMVSNNRRGSNDSPRQARTHVARITGIRDGNNF